MKVTMSVGPGPYAHDLIAQLGSRGVLERVLFSWPEASVQRWNPRAGGLERERTLPLYPLLVRSTWAAWRRLPGLGRHRHPQVWIDAAFDAWARRSIGRPDVFLGWSQVSLRSLHAARAAGVAAVLEHPMMHADLWQELMTEEYARFSPHASLTFNLRPGSMLRRMREEYDAADAIVVPSRAALESFVSRGVPPSRLALVPFGVRTEHFAPADAAARAGPFRLLFVGRLELLKGIHYLLDAWTRRPAGDAELCLVGPLLPELEAIVARHARPDIKIVGAVGRDEVAAHYQRADAVVFPSLCDGFGLVILEAMASGLPVVATSHTGGPDVIEEGQTGFVVPIRDPGALADRIAWLIAHRRQLPEMGRAARESVTARFTLDHYGARAVAAYEEIRQRQRAPSTGSLGGGSATSVSPK